MVHQRDGAERQTSRCGWRGICRTYRQSHAKGARIKIFPYICNTLKLILYDYYSNYLGSLVPYRRYCNQFRGKRELSASKRKMVGQIWRSTTILYAKEEKEINTHSVFVLSDNDALILGKTKISASFLLWQTETLKPLNLSSTTSRRRRDSMSSK